MKKENDTHNLCDTCLNVYPECLPTEIKFGNGLGGDNVIECDGYCHVGGKPHVVKP